MRDYTCCCITATCAIVVGLVIVLPIVLTITLNVRPSIEDATLTRFVLVPKPTSISYNLSTVIRLYNPNYYYGIYFDSLEANFLFEGQRFDWVTLPTFYQHPKKTNIFRPVIGGDSIDITLGTTGLDNFVSENRTGVFNLEVQLSAHIRYKPNKYHCELLARCPFTVQLGTGSTGKNSFERAKCDVEYPNASDDC
ncbi:NDR1/HIN1-like protein 10 [Ananas comosus]|uniref:NDR1/HIN1-like protein 10 n=1 Tax=Ananas comosus TaxID=4615 RepID=A0A6P5FPK0_ANACO|nr:NDR1/HIN1-like protein 10 [Ananas comosus]